MLVNLESCLSAEGVMNPTQAKVGEEMTKRGIADQLAGSSVKRRSSSQYTRHGGEPPVPGAQVPGGLLPSLPKTWLWTKLELVKEEAQSADYFSFGTREKEWRAGWGDLGAFSSLGGAGGNGGLPDEAPPLPLCSPSLSCCTSPRLFTPTPGLSQSPLLYQACRLYVEIILSFQNKRCSS